MPLRTGGSRGGKTCRRSGRLSWWRTTRATSTRRSCRPASQGGSASWPRTASSRALAIVRWFLREYGAFPLKRTGIDVGAHRWALDQLRRDQVIAVFPEGTRSRGGMKRARPGVVRLALTTQAPILPVGITGTERLGTWLRVLNPTGQITVTIGRPFTLPVIEGKPSPAVMESLTEMVMREVAVLLPPSYRGVYGEPEAGVGVHRYRLPCVELPFDPSTR